MITPPSETCGYIPNHFQRDQHILAPGPESLPLSVQFQLPSLESEPLWPLGRPAGHIQQWVGPVNRKNGYGFDLTDI